MSFFPYDRDILTSSLWANGSPEAFKVWSYLLLSADPRTGCVEDADPAIALRCGLPLAKTVEVLEWLAAPDQFSRTKDHEGRRIERLPGGGVRVLNFMRRQVKDYSTPRVRNWREMKRSETECNGGALHVIPPASPSSPSDSPNNPSTPPTDTNTDTNKRKTTSSAGADALAVLAYWQERTSTKLRSPKAKEQILARIKSRLRDGCSVADLKACVDFALLDPFYVEKGYAKKPDVIWRSAERVGDLANRMDAQAPGQRKGEAEPRRGPTREELARLDAETDR